MQSAARRGHSELRTALDSDPRGSKYPDSKKLPWIVFEIRNLKF